MENPPSMNEIRNRACCFIPWYRTGARRSLVSCVMVCALGLTCSDVFGAGTDWTPVLSGKTNAFEARFDDLKTGEHRLMTFPVTNNGTKMLRPLKAESACECLALLAWPESLMPGETGGVLADVHGQNAGGFDLAARLEIEGGGSLFFLARVNVLTTSNAVGAAPHPAALARVVRKRQGDLYRQASDVASDVAAGRVRVVDLRDTESWTGMRLKGSLRMPPASALRMTWLRNQPVLLVDEGWGSEETERVCRAVRDGRESGCWILWGGVAACGNPGSALEGRATAQAGKPVLLTPHDFLAARGFDDWQVVAPASRLDTVRALLPEAIPVESMRPDFKGRTLWIGAGENLAARPGIGFALEGDLAGLERACRDIVSMHKTRNGTLAMVTVISGQGSTSNCGCQKQTTKSQ